jgi:acetyltransferase
LHYRRKIMQDVSQLEVFFRPKSVAVVGASSDPKKPGYTALKNMISLGFKGNIYPINPREESILDLQCYRSILEIKEPVEAVVLLVSAELSVLVAKDLAEKKERDKDIQVVVCMSAGFGELHTPDGIQRERDLVETLRAADIRLIGPNCLGVMDTVSGFNTNFDIGDYPGGGVSVLTQSGAFGNSLLMWSGMTGLIGLNKYVSIGNMSDVQMHELLEYWKNDDTTRVIGIYLEGLSNTRAFFDVAREVTAVKPVVILKSGSSEMGSTAALSHTGAVAGADAIYDGAFKQAGVIRARSVAEFYDTLRTFAKQPVPKGNRVAILTHMGGPGTICIDEISLTPGLKMAEFSQKTTAALKEIISPSANLGNPPGYLDLTAAHTERLHHDVLEIMFNDQGVDAVIQILAPSAFLDQKLLAREVAAAWNEQGSVKKPLLNVVTFGDFASDLRNGLEAASLPTVDFPDLVARVTGNLVSAGVTQRAAQVRSMDAGIEALTPAGPASDLIARALDEGRVSLLEPEAYEICAQYGIEVPPYKMVNTSEDAVAAAQGMSYPVVLKVVSAEILHKTDIGGVMLSINSDEALTRSYEKLVMNVQRAASHITRPDVLVQRMMPSSTELVLGGLRDELFGAVVMAGMGGIYIEVLKQVGFRLAPVDLNDAINLIRQTLPPALVAGARGQKPMNVEAIGRAIVALGRIFADHPQIEQVDLNPFFPYEDRCIAVDARFIIAKK